MGNMAQQGAHMAQQAEVGSVFQKTTPVPKYSRNVVYYTGEAKTLNDKIFKYQINRQYTILQAPRNISANRLMLRNVAYYTEEENTLDDKIFEYQWNRQNMILQAPHNVYAAHRAMEYAVAKDSFERP